MATKLTSEILLKNGFTEKKTYFGDAYYEIYESFGDGSIFVHLSQYSDDFTWEMKVKSYDKYEDEPSIDASRTCEFENTPLTVEELQTALDLCQIKKTIKV